MKAPEPIEGTSRTAFQQALEANPFAQALATPVRQCQLSRTRLPSHFLVPFVTELPALNRYSTDGNDANAKPRIAPAIDFKSNRPKSYLLATEDAMRSMVGRKGKWPILVNDRMKRPYALRARKSMESLKVHREWVCDKDGLVDRVREQLRQAVKRNLKRCLLEGKDSETSLLVPLPAEGAAQPEKFTCTLRVGEQDIRDRRGRDGGYLVYGLDPHVFGDVLDTSMTGEYGVVKHKTTAYLITALERYRNFGV